ncbi:MAG: DUF4783 domain-containing protein [Marinilabiliaceae bacterium]|nr:DUF4783 domain-containing protein [Marinilabiliaceae bacterium]
MKIFKIIFLITTLVILAHQITAQTFPQGIVTATQQGNAVLLAQHFNDKVEIILPSKSGVYSKEQAQFVMKDFFASYRPTSFKINHEGKRDNSSYAIGNYVSAREQFRFYFLTRNVNGRILISQIRIDKQDD